MRVFNYIWQCRAMAAAVMVSLSLTSCITDDRGLDSRNPDPVVTPPERNLYVYRNAIADKVEIHCWVGSPPIETVYKLNIGQKLQYEATVSKDGTVVYGESGIPPLASDSTMLRFPLLPPNTPRVIYYRADRSETQRGSIYNKYRSYIYSYDFNTNWSTYTYTISRELFDLSGEEGDPDSRLDPGPGPWPGEIELP